MPVVIHTTTAVGLWGQPSTADVLACRQSEKSLGIATWWARCDMRPRAAAAALALLLCACGAARVEEAASLRGGALKRSAPRPSRGLGLWRDGIKNGAASGMATVCAKTLLQPFDTLKTLQQRSGGSGDLIATCTGLVRTSGVGALYRGLGVSLIGAVPAMSAYFAVYQATKTALLSMAVSVPPMLLVAFSAAFSNCIATGLRVPCELVKQQIQAGMYPTVAAAVRGIGAGGLRAFMPTDALLAQLARDIPFGVVMLLAYELLNRRRRADAARGAEWPPWASAVCGAAAGGLATLATNPMDVVKTRMMTRADPAAADGVIRLARNMYASEGPSAFFRGVKPRLLHKVPSSTLFWLLYEAFRKLLRADDAAV